MSASSKATPPQPPSGNAAVSAESFKVGAKVRILSVASCAVGLPSEDQIRLKSYEGMAFTVVDIDEYGMIWFDADGGLRTFCLLPSEVAAT